MINPEWTASDIMKFLTAAIIAGLLLLLFLNLCEKKCNEEAKRLKKESEKITGGK